MLGRHIITTLEFWPLRNNLGVHNAYDLLQEIKDKIILHKEYDLESLVTVSDLTWFRVFILPGVLIEHKMMGLI